MNDPAFPTIGYSKNASGAIEQLLVLGGMTKRELIAMHLMEGLLASGGNWHEAQKNAMYAIQQADALLAELSKEPK